ncbi:MAG TPA: 30S ribosome-binding factor RbfA [Syntrophales bacterium]|nr:30S ribosome-binding factor RbfA [Syntrophales bacterium]HOM06314.1 30S ribosome-binding factor RbfA [Syntrophales bacterium]HON99247.1 30S ribosome-binding factor RbfA [Syntrophales bacterium]HPC00072.1 30S ribosome-binding factor RbfA [Syntrophales bacterium]HPQ05705.1 30S ribosome-binding factor RbfA [Syntrophales bacterium]
MTTFKRADRVADRIREEMAEILHREMGDVRVSMVTVTGVKVSEDLRHAKIYFVEMGQETCRPETESALRGATGFLRRELGRRLRLRYVPEIVFVVDGSFAYGSRIDRIITELQAQERERDEGDH